MEQLLNSAISTLTAGIDNSQTTFDVADGSVFVAECRVKVDSELMLVTDVTGDTLTVTRGIESTSAASHASGATVQAVLTVGSLQALQSVNVNLGGDEEPSSGQLHLTNEPVGTLRLNHASTWTGFGLLQKWESPPTTDWTWLEQGLATLTSTPASQKLTISGTGANNYGITRSLGISLAGDFQVTMGIIYNLIPFNNSVCGMSLYYGTKHVVLYIRTESRTIRLRRATYSGGSWTYQTNTDMDIYSGLFHGVMFLRLAFIGNLTYAYISADSINWCQLNSSGLSQSDAYGSGNVPASSLFFISNTYSSAETISAQLVHYKEEVLA